MNNYYIDLSYQNSSELLRTNNGLNFNINNGSNLNNNNNNLIEGFSNFGRVNLEKCCPLEYMWSEKQNKCVKVCSGCAIGAYGDINYEFLNSNGEFMSHFSCRGDATGAYDFDKINKRYDKSELLNQYDMNMYIDHDEETSGIQPADGDPWSPVMGGLHSDYKKQTNIRTSTYGGWDDWVSYNSDGSAESVHGVMLAVSDQDRLRAQDNEVSQEEQNEINLLNNRITYCNIISDMIDSNQGSEDLESLQTNLCPAASNNIYWPGICRNIIDNVPQICSELPEEINIHEICPDLPENSCEGQR